MPQPKPQKPRAPAPVLHDLNVFVNCPFDDAYRPLFRAIVFTVSFCGFRPRSALEKSNSAEPRITKILRIIKECRLGIHDISRTEPDPGSNLPRFNMPFELGIFLGMMHSGAETQIQKECLILDRETYRYQKFLSDISGQDIQAHDNNPVIVIRKVRDWLNDTGLRRGIPGPDHVNSNYEFFANELPTMALDAGFAGVDSLNYNDLMRFIFDWIGSQQRVAKPRSSETRSGA